MFKFEKGGKLVITDSGAERLKGGNPWESIETAPDNVKLIIYNGYEVFLGHFKTEKGLRYVDDTNTRWRVGKRGWFWTELPEPPSE